MISSDMKGQCITLRKNPKSLQIIVISFSHKHITNRHTLGNSLSSSITSIPHSTIKYRFRFGQSHPTEVVVHHNNNRGK